VLDQSCNLAHFYLNECAVIYTIMPRIGLMIYHIMTFGDWARASSQPFYIPDAFVTNGFIHCCNADQLEYVGDRYFRGQKDLIILCIEADNVTAPVKHEDLNAEGMSFPHIYGILNTDAVKKIVNFPSGDDGTFRVPNTIFG
jgi:uncharacterized protein (DUF952 family)